jgi:small conductance mechanosensitive channel
VAFSRHESGARAQQLRTVAGVITSVGTFLILFVAAMMVLSVVQINMGPLLASAGVAGLAIGFGAQTLVHDVINGFFILLENQYAVGDVVRVAGVKGTVEAMSMRNTTLRDDDGTLHIVPNSEIKIVSNLTRDWAQISLHVSVAYNEDSDRVVKLLTQLAEEVRNDPAFRDDIVAEPQVPGIERVSGGEVDYLLLVKTRPGQQYRVSREMRRRIKDCFQKNKIQAGNPARVYVLEGTPGAGQA